MRAAPLVASVLVFLAPSMALPQPALAQETGSAPATAPPPPPVEDPMLAPVPPPKRVLSSWAEAQQLLRARSSNLRIALDQVLQAEGQTIVALAQYLPSLGGCAGGSSAPPGCVNGSYTHQLLTRSARQNVTGEPKSSVVPVPDTFQASLTISQDIINAQELDQIGINKLVEESSRMTVEDTRRTLDFGLATQIVLVVTAERSAEINRAGLRVALEQLELTRRKASLGVATRLDVVRAEQNAANARVSLVHGDEALRQSREALGLMVGIPTEIGIAPEMDVGALAQDTLRACRAVDTIEERPDVAAARKNLEIAKRNLRSTYYSFLPVVTGQSALTVTTTPNSGYPNPTWSIGAAVSIPIFDGGTRFGQIKGGRAAEDIARETLDALRRQALVQVEQAQREMEVADAAYRVTLEQRDLAAQNDVLTQTLWSKGQGTSVDLVTASEAHRQAEQSLVVAEFDIVKARLAAILALSTCPR
jgi:outer membrane protein TolC